MVDILAIGDLHFKSDNELQTDVFEKNVICHISNTKYDAIVILGDILHRHDKIDLNPLQRACKFLAEVRKTLHKTSPLFILIGNHDLPNNAAFLSDNHAFNALKLWQNTYVADVPMIVKVKDCKLLLVPYVPPGRFEEAIKGYKNLKKCNAVFAHQEFQGAKMGPIISQSRDIYPEDAPFCFSGHIHEWQIPQSNLIYTGTPFNHSYNTESDKYSPVSIHIEKNGEIETTRLFGISESVPKNYKIICENVQECEKLLKEFSENPIYNIVKIFVKCDAEESKTVKNMKKYGLSVVPLIVKNKEIEQVQTNTFKINTPFYEKMLSSRNFKNLSPETLNLFQTFFSV